MKKVFPSIIVLISLSLIGLMLLQISWIQNVLKVQNQKYYGDLSNACIGVSMDLRDALAKRMGYNPTEVNWGDKFVEELFWNQLSHIPEKEISEIIKDELDKNNIDLPFEFDIITSDFSFINSPGYSPVEMYANSIERPLNASGSYSLRLYIVQPKDYILRRSAWMISASVLFTIIILLAFAVTVRTVFKQKQLSEIKSDFINNMTHEFKTPIATISLAVDALGNPKVQGKTDQVFYYTGIIREENKRMHKQVEKILQAAQLDADNLELKLQTIDVHQIIHNAATNITLLVEEKQGILVQNLKAKKYFIKADEVHFSNIIANLLDNAIKYSKAAPHITIQTSNPNAKTLMIQIKDNGIGMSKEIMNHIFEKFYRAHTGNLHNVKGFGLGLSYVKTVVDAHHGKIKVDSIIGKGSEFVLEFSMT